MTIEAQKSGRELGEGGSERESERARGRMEEGAHKGRREIGSARDGRSAREPS